MKAGGCYNEVMELYSTRLDLWYGEYYYDPDEWEDDMDDVKWPANEAQARIVLRQAARIAEEADVCFSVKKHYGPAKMTVVKRMKF